jgi:hypothetical protein
MYCFVAVLGYLMFGEDTQSQYTLNMPRGYVAYKIAVWTTVCYYTKLILHSIQHFFLTKFATYTT